MSQQSKRKRLYLHNMEPINVNKLEKALSMAKDGLYDDVKYLGKWHGYDVYRPTRKESSFTGFPQFILNKQSKWRWTNDWEESNKIMGAIEKIGKA